MMFMGSNWKKKGGGGGAKFCSVMFILGYVRMCPPVFHICSCQNSTNVQTCKLSLWFSRWGASYQIRKQFRERTNILTRHSIKIIICFKSYDSRMQSEMCKLYSSKNSEFKVRGPSQRICMFEHTRLGIGMTLDLLIDRFTKFQTRLLSIVNISKINNTS